MSFTPIGNGLSNRFDRAPIDNRSSKEDGKPSNDEVDALADEVVAAYNTPSHRRWYCQLCYKLGTQGVRVLMDRAKEGRQPGRLFSTLAKKAEAQHDARYGASYGS